MRACSSTPPKQNQDLVKEHNRSPLNNNPSYFVSHLLTDSSPIPQFDRELRCKGTFFSLMLINFSYGVKGPLQLPKYNFWGFVIKNKL